MKDKFAFRYDRNTRKGILITKDGEKEIQKITDGFIKEIDEVSDVKQKEIMSI